MKDNECIINSILHSCLTGYSVYDDDIVECITKENRSLIRGLTRQEQLKLLCDIITMAYTDGHGNKEHQVKVAATASETNSDDDKLNLNNLINRDQYRHIKGMNRKQFIDFLFDLYNNIYEEQKSNIDYTKIREEVLKINGIGNVKADAIVKTVRQCLENKEGDS